MKNRFAYKTKNVYAGVVKADVKVKMIVISTEFFTSGQDSYEVYAVDNLKEPFRLSKTFTLSSHTENESVRKDVNLEVFSLIEQFKIS